MENANEEKRAGQFFLENSSPNEIESDGDTLEPFDDEEEHAEVNTSDPDDIARWAKEFQLSIPDFEAVIVMNGKSIRAIKKYLSI